LGSDVDGNGSGARPDAPPPDDKEELGECCDISIAGDENVPYIKNEDGWIKGFLK